MTTDPYREFHSPYLAMGNNWINKIDPDGGKTDDIIYLDSNGNEINRIAWEGDHIYMQETYSGDFVNGLNVGSFERIESPDGGSTSEGKCPPDCGPNLPLGATPLIGENGFVNDTGFGVQQLDEVVVTGYKPVNVKGNNPQLALVCLHKSHCYR